MKKKSSGKSKGQLSEFATTKSLYSEAKNFLNMKALFPRSKNVGRNGLTDYQVKVVKREMRKLIAQAGSLDYLRKSFVKLRRTKSAVEYMQRAGVPKASRGVIIAGGEGMIKKARVRRGFLIYERGHLPTAIFPINAVSEKSIRYDMSQLAGVINNPQSTPYLCTAGGKIVAAEVTQRGRQIGYMDATNPDKSSVLTEAALNLFLKYEAMAKMNMLRSNGRRAVHPSRWGLSVLVEKNPTRNGL